MENRQLSKTYNPEEVEHKLYTKWLENRYFHSEPDHTKKPYSIVIPPPNITGQLHMGHALNNTLQDVLIRWKRMQGYCTLWLPGTDHASIATEAKIVEAMAKEGVSKADIGREGFIDKAWEWRKVYGGRIVEQLKKLGSSCDWERERFTMDEGLSKAVNEVFVRLYEKDLIYRGERIINWCPKCCTSISDAEVEYTEKEGNFWYIKYPIKQNPGDGSTSTFLSDDMFLTVATTRPETMLGDTALAVNPEDERYAHLIGKVAILPLLNKEIPIIADSYVDKDFGTGVVKITPAHDPNDFEVGMRHELPVIRVMDDYAVMNDNAGIYKGLDRYDARKKIIEDLQAQGLLVKTEPHQHNVGECYRCTTVIEPIISKQWFVKMKPLAEPALEAVRNGEIKFIPERFSKTYFNWMENIRDWCISRQLWWGHRIPAYYCNDCGDITVSREKPDKCEKCGSANIKQDEDTLDTWFSSALWPFSTLGWPDNTEDLKYFYPTNVLVTAYDIIFFWVARMIFSGLEQMGERPFEHVFIHGIVRDADGKKMSKSLGNGIDPLELIADYGTDALRFALSIGISPGNDMRFSLEKIESARNIANKIWNAARFVLMQFTEEDDLTSIGYNKLMIEDKWILSRLNTLIAEATSNLDNFDMGLALQKIYEFIREEFCDWYIELVKPRLYDRDNVTAPVARYILNKVLFDSMKLLHPFMPFITEEIYMHLAGSGESIMISKWPEYSEQDHFPAEEQKMNKIMDAIRSIRNIRAENNVPPSKKAQVILVCASQDIKTDMESGKAFFERLAYSSETIVTLDKSGVPNNAATAVISGVEIFIPFEQLIDIEKEIERLKKEKENLESEIERVNSKLSNESFVARAPAKVVEGEKGKQQKYQDMYNKVLERLETFKNQ
jgi:valyl-tRNA synthetase